MLKAAREEVILPEWQKLIDEITRLANEYKTIPLLSRTHANLPHQVLWVKKWRTWFTV